MRLLIVICFLLVGYSSISQQDTLTAYDEMLNERYKRTVPLIQPAALYRKMLDGEKIILLDTREQREFAVSSLNGAAHIGFLFYSKKRVAAVGKDETIVVYCTIGARSETIGERLIKNDYQNVYNLYGGIIQWKNEGYPVYTGDKQTDEVHVYSKKWGQWLIKGKGTY